MSCIPAVQCVTDNSRLIVGRQLRDPFFIGSVDLPHLSSFSISRINGLSGLRGHGDNKLSTSPRHVSPRSVELTPSAFSSLTSLQSSRTGTLLMQGLRVVATRGRQTKVAFALHRSTMFLDCNTRGLFAMIMTKRKIAYVCAS
jgi:hypothetical protein